MFLQGFARIPFLNGMFKRHLFHYLWRELKKVDKSNTKSCLLCMHSSDPWQMHSTFTKPFSPRLFKNSIKNLFLSCPLPFITNSVVLILFSVCCITLQKYSGKTVWDLLFNGHEYKLGGKMHACVHIYVKAVSIFYQSANNCRHILNTCHNIFIKFI